MHIFGTDAFDSATDKRLRHKDNENDTKIQKITKEDIKTVKELAQVSVFDHWQSQISNHRLLSGLARRSTC